MVFISLLIFLFLLESNLYIFINAKQKKKEEKKRPL